MTSLSELRLPSWSAASPNLQIDDDPSRELRASLMVLMAFGVLFMGWATIAPLDAAASASGQISVSGHNEIVAHREGGVVARVDVTEGEHVRSGQVLVELAPEDVGADVSALRAQVISLQAKQARLSAELTDSSQIDWPASFASLDGDDLATAKAAIRIQAAQFSADLGAYRAEAVVTSSKAQSLEEQIAGGQGQLDSNTRQQTLLGQELSGVSSLAEKGYASKNTVRSLERSAAELAGNHDQLTANVADYKQQIVENEFSLRNLRKQNMEAAAAALSETEDQLNADMPKLEAARKQLDRGTLRADMDGVVTGLSVFGPGTVAAPGQQLMEIVPTKPTLIVEARIAANDMKGVHVGQNAQVRFLSLDTHGAPILKGTVTELSADSFVDERSGQTYYAAQVAVPQSQLALLDQGRNSDAAVRPGLPVQVMIPLRQRTAFEYLFEPISQSLWQAFRQR